MSARLDQVLQKHPAHEDGVRLLAARDPSGNFKYLDWSAKVLASGQALAPEIADVIALFHQFNGRWFERRRKHEQIRTDIYSYRPQDLAGLRDSLLKIKRKQDRKRKQREKLYRLDKPVEVDVVYDSSDLIVRHIKNKQASVHYGLGTKWCISMLREGYFEDYEAQNATFFFFERKAPLGNDYDKVALMMPRNGDSDRGWQPESALAFTASDKQVDMLKLARAHGVRVFDIFRDAYERSERYPGSVAFQVSNGIATAEQLIATFDMLGKELSPYEVESLLEAICCNDAAPPTLLEEIARRAPELAMAAWKRFMKPVRRGGHHARPRRRHGKRSRCNNTNGLMRTISAAIAIHPQTPPDLRDKLVKQLRRRHIKVDDIRVVKRSDRVGVAYGTGIRGMKVRYGHRRHRRRALPLSLMRRRLHSFEGLVKRTKKKIKTLERKKKLAEAKKAAADKKKGRKS